MTVSPLVTPPLAGHPLAGHLQRTVGLGGHLARCRPATRAAGRRPRRRRPRPGRRTPRRSRRARGGRRGRRERRGATRPDRAGTRTRRWSRPSGRPARSGEVPVAVGEQVGGTGQLVGGGAVQQGHVVPRRERRLGHRVADEPGAADDQDPHPASLVTADPEAPPVVSAAGVALGPGNLTRGSFPSAWVSGTDRSSPGRVREPSPSPLPHGTSRVAEAAWPSYAARPGQAIRESAPA